jgi:hypothetical protein
MNPQLLALLRMALRRMRDLVEAIQEQSETTRQANARQPEQQLPTPPHPVTIDFADSVTKAKAEQDDKQYRLQERSIFWTKLTCLLIFVYTAIAALQWSQMRHATDAAEKAANAANETVTDSRKAFQADQRPYVITESPGFYEQLKPNAWVPVRVSLKNIGKTPAIDVSRRFQMFTLGTRATWGDSRAFLTDFQERVFVHLRERFNKPLAEDFLAKQDVAPNSPIIGTYQSGQIFPQKQLGEVMRGEITIFFVGIIRYTDTSGKPYETNFCYWFWATQKQPWLLCEAHNTIK